MPIASSSSKSGNESGSWHVSKRCDTPGLHINVMHVSQSKTKVMAYSTTSVLEHMPSALTVQHALLLASMVWTVSHLYVAPGELPATGEKGIKVVLASVFPRIFQYQLLPPNLVPMLIQLTAGPDRSCPLQLSRIHVHQLVGLLDQSSCLCTLAAVDH